ncbi:MAG: hypothetical protein HOV81_16895 [Kofleriaceae bacterium]|nr:hypothetical protein [Kofleriaceae bacterium]
MDRADHRAAVGILEQVGEALGRDRAGARALLESLWATVGDDGDPLHRCAIAHSLADVQDAPQDELLWDLRALAAGRELTDERVAEAGILGPSAAFFPSLHLNLADVYRRLGDPARSREHVAAGRAAIGSLQPDGYREMIEGGFDRIEAALEDRSAG